MVSAASLAERGVDDPDDNAAVRTGNAVSELVFDHHLTKSEKETGGAIAHYAMGVTSGAIYGAVAEMMPAATVAEGLPFGAAVWLIADEAIVPASRTFTKTQRIPTFDSRLRVCVAPGLRINHRISAPRHSPCALSHKRHKIHKRHKRIKVGKSLLWFLCFFVAIVRAYA